MDTVLQLKQYFFPYVEVAADPKITDIDDDTKSNFLVKVDTLPIEGSENEYQVTLEVVSQPESEEKRQFYAIKLISVGFFQVDSDWPNKEKLLRVTGASMLYSAAREFLITITARGPWGAIMLPTASFLRIYEANEKEAAGAPTEERKE